MSSKSVLLSAEQIASTLEALADKIVEKHGKNDSLALIGIQRRGVDIAKRLNLMLEKKLGMPVPQGTLDITLYRDDWTTLTSKPSVRQTDISFSVEHKTLILVDDVLFTGRTIRSALEALSDFGRPSRVELLVLVDRGHRELPIQADYAGLTVDTRKQDRVDVLLTERDGEDAAYLVHG